MTKFLINQLKPKSIWDKIGCFILIWTITSYFSSQLSYPNSTFLTVLIELLMLPALLLNKITFLLFPNADGLGFVGILVMLIIPSYMILLNILTIIFTYLSLKRVSLFLPIWTLFIIFGLYISYLGITTINTQKASKTYKENYLFTQDVKFFVKQCNVLSLVLEQGLEYNQIQCEITINDIPSIFSPYILTKEFQLSLGIGSKKFERYNMNELQKQSSVSGIDKEYLYNELNHLVWTSNIDASKIEIINDTSIKLDITAKIDSTIPIDSLYISEYTFEPTSLKEQSKGKVFRITDIELPLFSR